MLLEIGNSNNNNNPIINYSNLSCLNKYKSALYSSVTYYDFRLLLHGKGYQLYFYDFSLAITKSPIWCLGDKCFILLIISPYWIILRVFRASRYCLWPAKWFFLGYIFYMILVVAIAVTAVFYNHLEINMGKSIRGFKSVLAWIHLIGMNIEGTVLTMTMIFAGLIGSGILGVITSGSSSASATAAQYCNHGTIYYAYFCICRNS